MKCLVVINACGIDLETPFPERGKSLREYHQKQIEALGFSPQDVRYLLDPEHSVPSNTPFASSSLRKRDTLSLMETLGEISEGYHSIFYYWADTVFLNQALNEELLRDHKKYFSEYTFADGYPLGFTGEILSTSILPQLISLASTLVKQERRLDKESLFRTIQKEINRFDIETKIAPLDQRGLRLDLRIEKKVDREISLALFERWQESQREPLLWSIQRVQEEIQKEDFLRSVPAFYQLQLTTQEYAPSYYLPSSLRATTESKESKATISLSQIDSLAEQIVELSGEATIVLGYGGEIGLYPHLKDSVQRFLRHPSLTLILETGGVGFEEEILFELLEEGAERLSVVLNIEGGRPEQIQKRRPDLTNEESERLLALAHRLTEKFPENIYWQTTRLRGEEGELEEFYHFCQKNHAQILIKKYNHFSYELPERKVVDLAPFERNTCWHLKRDMIILADGTVPLCENDTFSTKKQGNINETPLGEIWRGTDVIYQEHLNKNLCEMCRKCDEYYTFNF